MQKQDLSICFGQPSWLDRSEITELSVFAFEQQKEDAMVVKLKEAEHSQLVTELRRKIAELELQVCFSLICS